MLWKELLKAGAIKFGDFTLTSGKKSNYYVDIKEAMTDPATLKEAVQLISQKIVSDYVSGVELGAVPLVVATSYAMEKPYIIIRKERNHGTGSLLVGKPVAGKSVDIIEDVITTGGSVARAVEILRKTGMVVRKVIVVVDREEGGAKKLSELGVEPDPVYRISELEP